jgi:hypothetical protein
MWDCSHVDIIVMMMIVTTSGRSPEVSSTRSPRGLTGVVEAEVNRGMVVQGGGGYKGESSRARMMTMTLQSDLDTIKAISKNLIIFLI